ncbi:MAG: hypothetical protein WCI72_06590 [archaeon]
METFNYTVEARGSRSELVYRTTVLMPNGTNVQLPTLRAANLGAGSEVFIEKIGGEKPVSRAFYSGANLPVEETTVMAREICAVDFMKRLEDMYQLSLKEGGE